MGIIGAGPQVQSFSKQQQASLSEDSQEEYSWLSHLKAKEESEFTVLFVDGWFSVNVDPLICGNEKQRCVIMGTSSEMEEKTKQNKTKEQQANERVNHIQRL